MTEKKTDEKKQAPTKVSAMDVFRAAGRVQTDIVKDAARAAVQDGYDNFLSRVGLNNDNELSAGTYVFDLITRNRILLEAAYRGSWITGRVIDSVADDMTRAGVNITTKETVDLQIFNKAMTRLQIWQSLRNVIAWGRLYGGALGVMQIAGQKLDTPLDPKTIAPGQFKGIAVFDRWMLNPLLTSVIEEGPDIGLPEYYQLVTNPQSYNPRSEVFTPGITVNTAGSMNVHHSRVIRFTGIDLPFFQAITEMMWGESVLERLWDRLISFDNASLSAAQLIDKANLRTVSIEGLRQVIAAGGEAMEGLLKHFEMMRQMQDNEGLTLLDKEDEFKTTAYTFAGLSDMLLQFAQGISGATEIPLIVLFSQSPAGLGNTGDTDLRIYYDGIKSKQENKLRNPLSTLFEVMWQSCYGKPTPPDFDFEFVSLWQMNEIDKANCAKTNTETIIGGYESGLVPIEAAMKDLRDMSGDAGLFSNISDEDIADAEAEEPPMPDDTSQTSSYGTIGPDGKENLPAKPKEKGEPVKTLDAALISPWRKISNWLSNNF